MNTKEDVKKIRQMANKFALLLHENESLTFASAFFKDDQLSENAG